jgi:HEAT repeat protein
MRGKVIAPALGLAMLILLLAWFVRPGLDPSAQDARAPAPAKSPATETPGASVHWPVSIKHAVLLASAPDSTQPSEDAAALETQRLAASIQRAAELRQLATTGDAGALDTILSELPNSDPSIRRAALAAAVEFGDRSAIPALTQALESNPDPQEKVNIQKAIDYLQLPSLSEREGAPGGFEPTTH